MVYSEYGVVSVDMGSVPNRGRILRYEHQLVGMSCNLCGELHFFDAVDEGGMGTNKRHGGAMKNFNSLEQGDIK